MILTLDESEKLDSGDPIDFTDVTGTVYHYQVIQTEILPDTAVEEMEQEIGI